MENWFKFAILQALHRCMNESISYDYDIPTLWVDKSSYFHGCSYIDNLILLSQYSNRFCSGTHRYVWPAYGEYSYVPVQRWVHNLEHGAIVAAYHPCVNKRQLDDYRKLVKKCLYRHIITPYENLDAERPFALIAWGHSLEMSVVSSELIVVFIRMNALQAPERISRNGQYTLGIMEHAKFVSDKDDNSLCPNMWIVCCGDIPQLLQSKRMKRERKTINQNFTLTFMFIK